MPYDPQKSRDILIRTVYGEAGGEPLAGKLAVANVLRNRLNSGQWGNDASQVAQAVDPKTGLHQFSMWNSGNPAGVNANKLSTDSADYKSIGSIIDGVFNGTYSDPTNGATHYYAPQGMPGGKPPLWAANGTNVSTIGNQVFMNLPGPADSLEARSRIPATPSVPGLTLASSTDTKQAPPTNPFSYGYQPPPPPPQWATPPRANIPTQVALANLINQQGGVY